MIKLLEAKSNQGLPLPPLCRCYFFALEMAWPYSMIDKMGDVYQGAASVSTGLPVMLVMN